MNSYRIVRARIFPRPGVINELMGKDASARFKFIMERAEDAEELDV